MSIKTIGWITLTLGSLLAIATTSLAHANDDLVDSIQADYENRLGDMFEEFHANPELSLAEFKTSKKIAKELRTHGFSVTENVGGTGVVALLKNGEGPLVMMRADMDGLPVEEKSGLSYASTATQLDPVTQKNFPVMHACGHDVHITSLIGTAKQMVDRKDQWSGTLMLIGQPAEERVLGARAMMEDNLWQRFGKPDYALAFHVFSNLQSGVINVVEGSPFAGADTVDIYVHGVGAHGAYPHAGRDPSGTKHNIISDLAHLQLTVRNTNIETRDTLLKGIKRIAENLGRAAGLPEDKLPEVIYSEESVPPTINNDAMVRRLKNVWQTAMGEDRVTSHQPEGMGAEDFPFFTTDPEIKSVYFRVGGTDKDYIAAAISGVGPAVPSHHSPLFKIQPEPAVTAGIEATVLALLDLMAPTQ